MIRKLLIGCIFGIRSERRPVDEIHFYLGYPRFCHLGLEVCVPDRSTFSKKGHGRMADGDILRCVFEMVVDRGAASGFVGGQVAAVDGSTIAAERLCCPNRLTSGVSPSPDRPIPGPS